MYLCVLKCRCRVRLLSLYSRCIKSASNYSPVQFLMVQLISTAWYGVLWASKRLLSDGGRLKWCTCQKEKPNAAVQQTIKQPYNKFRMALNAESSIRSDLINFLFLSTDISQMRLFKVKTQHWSAQGPFRSGHYQIIKPNIKILTVSIYVSSYYKNKFYFIPIPARAHCSNHVCWPVSDW